MPFVLPIFLALTLNAPAGPVPDINVQVAPNTICPPEPKDPPQVEADWNRSLNKLARLSRQFPKQPDLTLPMPVAGVRVQDVQDTWGGARDGSRQHAGQDIFAPVGTLVYSATAGLVWRVGTSAAGGNYVYVLGAGGRRYYYAHLAKLTPGLQEGTRVSAQTVLGTIGKTGNAKATPSHLHFAVFGSYQPKGVCRFLAINPLPLLRDRIQKTASR